MDTFGFLLWICPLMTVLAAFFTSGIQKFRFQRYLLYLLVFFVSFLFDLMALSYKNDVLDLIGSQVMLLALADFFWRGVRMRMVFLRISSLIIALVVLLIGYQDWIKGGPHRIYRFINSTVTSTSSGKLSGYYIKLRGVLKVKECESDKIVLFKKRGFGVLEQKCAQYPIPKGYEKAKFSYNWIRFEERVGVQIKGDEDILWTLADPGPPK